MQFNSMKTQSIIIGSEKSITQINNKFDKIPRVGVYDFEIEFSNPVKYLFRINILSCNY